MIEKNLSNLKLSIDSLIDSRRKLISENNKLRKELSIAQQQNKHLLNKKEEISNRLKDVLSKIREGALCL